MGRSHDDNRKEKARDPEQYQPVGTAEIYWEHRDTFAPYLRRLRREAALSLREAATTLGLPFTRLQKLETGGRSRAPEFDFLKRLAALYERPEEEVFDMAGITMLLPEGFHTTVDYEQDFRTLVLESDLRPQLFDKTWCETFLFLNKQQWVEFAHKLEALVLRQGPCVGRVLTEQLSAESDRDGSAAGGMSDAARPVAGKQYFIGGHTYYWRPTRGFGAWMRHIREAKGLNLRDAASQLGMSFSMLQRLETGALIQPTVSLLWQIVWLYGVPLEELCSRSGIEVRPVEGLVGLDDEERAFAALMLHSSLKPVAMDSHWIETWPRRHKLQLVEFAWKLERHILEGRPRVRELLARAQRQSEGEKR